MSDIAERLRRELEEVALAIGSVRFMDPPDGGDVSLAEQVRRMRTELENRDEERDGKQREIERLRGPNMVSSAPQSTTEGLSMPDIADFADELEALIQEHLEGGVERAAVKATLAAKLKEMNDEDSGDEDIEEGEPVP